jgi:hypothetical protein
LNSIIRRGLPLALAVATMLAVPAIAPAATVSNNAGILTFTGGTGASDDTLSQGSGPNDVRIDDYYSFSTTTDPIVAAPDCTLVSDNGTYRRYDCPGVLAISATLGDGDDSLDLSSLSLPGNVDGGNGDDQLYGSRAGDTLRGAAGDDQVYGNEGNDTIDGGAGDDTLQGDAGDDDVHGGTGVDSVSAFVTDPGGVGDGPSSSATLDDQANDAFGGEGTDNVHSDVENVAVYTDHNTAATTPSAVTTLVGTAGANSLTVSGFAKGNIDGGAGNDVLSGGAYDDTINAADGFADVVTCGGGNDTVTADQFDSISDSCENVTVRQVGSANDDKQPAVAWTSPADGATLPTTAPTTLTVNASDDKGIAKVQFLAGTRIVCEDATAPYTCSYTPTGADAGKQVLSAIAIDTSQNATTALRSVRVARFAPKLSERLTPTRDVKAPYRFRVSGALTPPSGMSKAEACSSGRISTQYKAGRKTISTRRVDLKSNCTYSVTTTFNDRARFGKATRLKVTVRFSGNTAIAPKTLTSRYVRVR